MVDNAPSFTKQFDSILAAAGVNVMRTAIQAPNMNALAERWVQSAKRECLSRMIVFGERHLRRVLGEYVAHYNRDRPHQGIGNRLITPPACDPPTDGEVLADESLGGLLRSYRRAA